MTQQPGRLLGAALGLVLITGIVHFVIGLSEIGSSLLGDGALGYGLLLLSAGLLGVGLVGSFYTGLLTPVYTAIAGAELMVVFLFAYADVHAIGTLESLTGAELHAHDHNGHDHNGHDHNGHDHNGHDHNGHDHSHDGDSASQTVVDHLRDDLVALGVKIAESTAAVLFAAFAITHRD